MARKSSYTIEQADQACDVIANGGSVQAAADALGIGAETIYSWLRKEPLFAEKYARARQHRADSRYERIDQIMQDLRDQKIDPATARVLVDTVKWQCGKEMPARYGDQLAVTGAAGAPLVPSKIEVVLVSGENGKA